MKNVAPCQPQLDSIQVALRTACEAVLLVEFTSIEGETAEEYLDRGQLGIVSAAIAAFLRALPPNNLGLSDLAAAVEAVVRNSVKGASS